MIVYFMAVSYINTANGTAILVLVLLSIWAYLKTMLTDPGSVSKYARPLPVDTDDESRSICGRCNGFKPWRSHHDRVSDRCISRMDHFCPWTNNSIGAKNQKHFFLFLTYGFAASAYVYILLITHLLLCSDDINCGNYTVATLNSARVFVFLVLLSLLFTGAMLWSQVHGLVIGLGTIDRMKAAGHGSLPVEQSIPFGHVFGNYWPTHFLPFDPMFILPEEVLHYEIGSEEYSNYY